MQMNANLRAETFPTFNQPTSLPANRICQANLQLPRWQLNESPPILVQVGEVTGLETRKAEVSSYSETKCPI